MTGHYAEFRGVPARLTKSDLFEPQCCFELPGRRSLTIPHRNRYGDAMRVADTIAAKLNRAFAPESLSVVDESDQHRGHAGHRPGGETHFRIDIVAQAFKGKSRLERHRLINQALARELDGGVHALAIHAAAPDELSA